MAAVSSDPPETTLVLTDAGSGGLVSRRWVIDVVGGPDVGQVVDRDRGTVVVGSHGSVDLRLTDPAVSRYHAELRLLSDGVLVTDLGSRNGVRVGGRKVERVMLPPGGRVQLGKTIIEVRPVDAPVEAGDQIDRFGDFVTQDAATRRLLAQLRLVAHSDATVLIEGDTGTGKELLARALHAASGRRDHPQVVVDCGAVSPTLLESQLFGHLKGAFTGATEDRAGAFEAAEGGTVFLDELGELPLDLQPKLLRVLEARTVRRLGDVRDRPVDVRFVAATHRHLGKMVQDGAFREDVFFRVAVVRMRIPPLAERLDDVPLLAQVHLQSIMPQGRLTEAAQAALIAYDWPGNGRELRNVIERAAALATGPHITAEDLFGADRGPNMVFREAKDQVIADFERRYVAALLARHEGNVSAAAREAGLSRNALYSLMKRVGLAGD